MSKCTPLASWNNWSYEPIIDENKLLWLHNVTTKGINELLWLHKVAAKSPNELLWLHGAMTKWTNHMSECAPLASWPLSFRPMNDEYFQANKRHVKHRSFVETSQIGKKKEKSKKFPGRAWEERKSQRKKCGKSTQNKIHNEWIDKKKQAVETTMTHPLRLVSQLNCAAS